MITPTESKTDNTPQQQSNSLKARLSNILCGSHKRSMWSKIHSLTPGMAFGKIGLDDACKMSVNLLEHWLDNHQKQEPTNAHLGIAIKANNVEVVEYLLTWHLFTYHPMMLPMAVETNNMDIIRHIESLAKKEAIPEPQPIIRREMYFLREKLIMLKDLRQRFNLVPPIPEEDPELSVHQAVFQLYLLIFDDISPEVFEHIVASGHPIFKDSNSLGDTSLEDTDGYFANWRHSLEICKYLYRRVPCRFNTPPGSYYDALFFDDVVVPAIEADKADIIKWCLEIRPSIDYFGSRRELLTYHVYTNNAINVLRALDQHKGFPYVNLHEREIGSKGDDVFMYYYRAGQLSPDVIQGIFARACLSPNPILYHTMIGLGLRPTIKDLERAWRWRANDEIIHSMIYDFHLPHPGFDFVSTLYVRHDLVTQYALDHFPHIYTDDVLIRAMVSNIGSSTRRFDMDTMQMIISHFREHGAEMRADYLTTLADKYNIEDEEEEEEEEGDDEEDDYDYEEDEDGEDYDYDDDDEEEGEDDDYDYDGGEEGEDEEDDEINGN